MKGEVGHSAHVHLQQPVIDHKVTGHIPQDRVTILAAHVVAERGVEDFTLACGTGSTAALAAAVVNGKCEPYAKLLLRGGELNIEWNRDENLIYMTGPAVTVFDGELLL